MVIGRGGGKTVNGSGWRSLKNINVGRICEVNTGGGEKGGCQRRRVKEEGERGEMIKEENK